MDVCGRTGELASDARLRVADRKRRSQLRFMTSSDAKDEPGSTDRTLLVVPDANVLIHGKALVDLPWQELKRDRIEVVFVPPVVRELDKLKNQTGRPNKAARQISSDVRALIGQPEHRVTIGRSKPQLSKRLELRRVEAMLNPVLKADHADHALINYALWLAEQGEDVLLLTDDTICGTTASEVGLAVHFLPETWLRTPEPDEKTKENSRLKAENQRLRAAEPEIEIGFVDGRGEVLTALDVRVERWRELDDGEVAALMETIACECPIATSFDRPRRATDQMASIIERISSTSALAFRDRYEPATPEEIERYRDKEYPEWLADVEEELRTLHEGLLDRTDWPRFGVSLGNVGTRPAAETLLSVVTKGALELRSAEKPRTTEDEAEGASSRTSDLPALPLPPRPPRGNLRRYDPLSIYGSAGVDRHALRRSSEILLPHLAHKPSRDPGSFYWKSGDSEWQERLELECASWRHAQGRFTISLQLNPDQMQPTRGVVEVAVEAHNLADPARARMPVTIEIDDGDTLEVARSMVGRLGEAARKHGLL